jgi:hypothetical protein
MRRDWWRMLAQLPGLAAVEALWRARLGEDYERYQGFIHPSGERAHRWPRLRPGDRRPGLPIREMPDGSLVAGDAESGERLPLSHKEAAVQTVDPGSLAAALARGLSLEANYRRGAGHPQVIALGTYALDDGHRIPTYLVIAGDRAVAETAITAACQDAGGACVVLTTGLAAPSGDFRIAGERRNQRVVLVDDLIGPDREGRLVADGGPEAIFGPLRTALGIAPAGSSGYRFAIHDGQLTLTWDHVEKTIDRVTIGMRYLHELVRQRDTAIPVEVLVGKLNGVNPDNLRGSKGVKTDRQGRADLRKRIKGLDVEMKQAVKAGDMDRFDRLQENQRILQDRLDADEGLGGADVQASDLDRQRIAVKQAIDRAIVGIGKVLPAMAAHFQLFVQTSKAPCYRPSEAERRSWET